MRTKCPTCKSVRCGNYAACARRHEAAAKWWVAWCEVWGHIGFCAHLVIKVRAVHPDATVEEILRAYVKNERERVAMEGRGCEKEIAIPSHGETVS